MHQAVELLRAIKLPGVQTFVEPVKDYRFRPRSARRRAIRRDSRYRPPENGRHSTAGSGLQPGRRADGPVGQSVDRRGGAHPGPHPPANMLTLRGFCRGPNLPSFPPSTRCGRRRWRSILCTRAWRAWWHGHRPVVGESPPTSSTRCAQNWDKYDFFFIHIKKTDSSGEDGNFERQGPRHRNRGRGAAHFAGPEPTC